MAEKLSTICIRYTPHCNQHQPYTATIQGVGWYGWGRTPEEASEKLVQLMEEYAMAYYVTYREHAEMDEATHNTIASLNTENNIAELEEIIENCTQLDTSAELFNEAGFPQGTVHKDGSYQLR